MEGGSILERHGERHIQVNGDLPLPLLLPLTLPLDAAAAATARSVHTLKGLFTRYDCDCNFFSSQEIGSMGYQCKCSQGAITTMTLNHMQPISCRNRY